MAIYYPHANFAQPQSINGALARIAAAPEIGFDRYIISATTPFTPDDLWDLRTNAPQVVQRLFPDYEEEYTRRDWKMFPDIARVYVNEKARSDLGWQPRYDFRYALNGLKAGIDPRSPLSRVVGAKGYHAHKFAEGPYPV